MPQNRRSPPGIARDESITPHNTSVCQSGDRPFAESVRTSLRSSDGIRAEFWYSRKQAMLLVAGLFILTRIFGSLTPPFQSPDEYNHIARAYLLSKGVLAVGSREGRTGAGIDEGLLAYMDCFRQFTFDYGVKVDSLTVRVCEEIHFTGRRRFSDLLLWNTAMYFPLPYAPQAVALLFGEKVGLTVSNSYYLARLFSSCATLALLMLALTIYPVPPAALAIFLMPMCLFQLSSASLDAMTFGITALAASLFLRGCRREGSFNATLHSVLAVCLFLLATSRIVYVALTPLLLVLYGVRRSPIYVISFVAILALSLAWIIFALTTVPGQGAIAPAISPSEIIRYYVTHPLAYFAVVFRTLTDASTIRSYWQMFVGILGQFDTPIGFFAYVAFAIELLAILIVSNSVASFRSLNYGHLALACSAAATLVLLLLAALAAMTPHPATLIQGIQGRYFYPIALLFLFTCSTGHRSGRWITLSFALLALTAASSVELAVPRLLARYYTH